MKAAYSFIPSDKLPPSLLEIIKPYLKASYSNQNYKMFCNNCAYWLREHLEKKIRLITEDYVDVHSIPEEERKKYSSQSALNNIRNLDEENCLILLELTYVYSETGKFLAPVCYAPVCLSEPRWGSEYNIPTHVATYCLNILHKKYAHNQYTKQTAFVCFDKCFGKAFRFIPKYGEWDDYELKTKNGDYINFISVLYRGIKDTAPDLFPLVEKEGRKIFTPLRTEEGDKVYKQFRKYNDDVFEKYQKSKEWEERNVMMDMDYQREIDDLNRDFWRECGEAGSNCESWPGWY